MWPDRRYLDLVGIEHPIVQAPMAGANLGAMAIAVSRAGGLGSLPCGMLNVERRGRTEHHPPANGPPDQRELLLPPAARPDPEHERRWRERLAPYYAEHGIEPADSTGGGSRAPFDAAMCALW